MTSGIDGLDLLHLRAEHSGTKVLILLRGHRYRRIVGLDAGADIYLIKPAFGDSRYIRTLLRRYTMEKTSDVGRTSV